MKPSPSSPSQGPSGKLERGAHGRSDSSLARPRSRFDLARAQLRQAVGGVLSHGLEALGDRLQLGPSSSALGQAGALRQVGVAAQVHGQRLREVIERDRALIASNPEPAASLPAGAAQVPTNVELAPVFARAPEGALRPAAPLTVELAFELLSEPFVASAAAVAPPAPVLCDEPIRTRTMAKLLAAQGHRQRALSIYDYLLAKSSDESLRAEADSLRATELDAAAQ